MLLDEPFVGMSSQQRARLRQAVQRRWPLATLLFVAHDLSEVLTFPRVLVFAEGVLVADGDPKDLAALPGSPLQQMVAADETLKQRLWRSAGWRTLEPFA